MQSGHVGEVQVKQTGSLVFFKAKVIPSMRKDQYTVTVARSVMSGTVTDASCHCKASALSRCSHVAALLLYISASAPAKPVLTSHVSRTVAQKEQTLVESTVQHIRPIRRNQMLFHSIPDLRVAKLTAPVIALMHSCLI